MPYTEDEAKTRDNLIREYGPVKGRDIFNKLRASGKLGQGSKDRMMERATKARRGEKVPE